MTVRTIRNILVETDRDSIINLNDLYSAAERLTQTLLDNATGQYQQKIVTIRQMNTPGSTIILGNPLGSVNDFSKS